MSGAFFIEETDRARLAADLAGEVASVLRVALAHRGRAGLAVPGGTTPGPFLTKLGARDLDWARVTVTLTDERQVPPDHPRSNRRLLEETLFAGKAASATYLPPDDPALADLLPLDAVVLGMGEDMHTASLFPGADRLAEALSASAPPAMALSAPGAPESRVSLTAPVLTGARHRFLLIHGGAKRAALERAESVDLHEAPVRIVLDADPAARIFWAP